MSPSHWKLAAWTAALITPLMFVGMLLSLHSIYLKEHGRDFAYPDRVLIWTSVSSGAVRGDPILCVRDESGKMRAVESVYTDDLGFGLVVDLISRLSGKEMGRAGIFELIVLANITLLYALMFVLRRYPFELLISAILILFPSFFIPKEILGPDLFSLYGVLGLTSVTLGVLAWKGKTWRSWFAAGLLCMTIYWIRQAIGMILLLMLLVMFMFRIRLCRERLVNILQFAGGLLTGCVMVWFSLQGILTWRDQRLREQGMRVEAHQRHHTIFHPLYVGIGNIPNNPWGIIYSDKFAFDQILGPGNFETAHPCSQRYLNAVRDRYLGLWRQDGIRLLKCYAQHALTVIHRTIGWSIFLPGMAYAGFILWSWRKRSPPRPLTSGLILALAVTLLGFLAQSILIDFSPLYSHPSSLLGRFLLGFCLLDFLSRRGWIPSQIENSKKRGDKEKSRESVFTN